MAKVASEGKSWKEAFLSTLPPRKGAKGIDGGDNDDDDDDDNSSQDADSKSGVDDSQNDDEQVSRSSAANGSEEKKSGVDGSDNDDSKSAADVDVKTVTTVANSSETEKVVDDNEADKLERDKETKL